jgi:hypothetical protein
LKDRLFSLALVALAVLATTHGHASRARIEGTGSLEFLLEDDTATLTPFRVGNPAGLALIPRVNRFDLSGQWRYEEFNYAWGVTELRNIRRTYSTLPAITENDTIQFDGLTAFPVPKLALQAGGTLFKQADAYDFSADLSEPNRRLGYARAAYDLGGVQVGVEGRMNGGTEKVAGGVLEPGLVLEEGRTETRTDTVTGGLLFRYPSHPTGGQTRLSVGGLYSRMPLSPQREDRTRVYVEPYALRVNVTRLYRLKDYAVYGPDLFLEVPGKLQAGAFLRLTSVGGTMQVTSDQAALLGPDQPEYRVSESKGRYGGAGFKLTHAVSDFTDLKGGAFVSVSGSESDNFSPDGTRSDRSESDSLEFSMGMGIASETDYAAGFQYSLRTEGGSEGLAEPLRVEREVADQSFTLGGEDWFTEEWAYRIGITSQLIENKGETLYRADFFSTEARSRAFGTYLTAGLGHKRARLAADLRVHVGQASYLTGDTDRFATLGGALVTVTTFF